MPDYKNGKIYKLWSLQSEDDCEIYYGSTCDELRKRKNKHKSNKDCSSKILFEKYDDVRIEIIEDYPCDSKAELNKREGYHIRENKCLNKRISGRTEKEYKKEYYENNKEQLTEYHKEWREKNKEKQREYQEKNKEKIAEYQEKNKEKIKEKAREWYIKNKEKINEKHGEYRRKKKEEALSNLSI